jgi:hypothetical protein
MRGGETIQCVRGGAPAGPPGRAAPRRGRGRGGHGGGSSTAPAGKKTRHAVVEADE